MTHHPYFILISAQVLKKTKKKMLYFKKDLLEKMQKKKEKAFLNAVHLDIIHRGILSQD